MRTDFIKFIYWKAYVLPVVSFTENYFFHISFGVIVMIVNQNSK